MRRLLNVLFAALILPAWFIAMFFYWRETRPFEFVTPLTYAKRVLKTDPIIVSLISCALWVALAILVCALSFI